MPTAQPSVLAPAAYRRLTRELSRLLETGKARAREAALVELATTYWQVGRRLDEQALTERAGYGSAILRRLAEDLAIDERTLGRALTFARLYPKQPDAQLAWAHYRELITVRDAAERAHYQRLALDDGLTAASLRKAIREDHFHKQRAQHKRSAKARPVPLPRPTDASYLYRATVQRVVDGDTLDVQIDLGFAVSTRARVRLARLDAPPLDTPDGKAARDYLQAKLTPLPSIVLTTERVNLHGRYVAHLFYAPSGTPTRHETFEKGRYLNQQLLDAGVASRA